MPPLSSVTFLLGAGVSPSPPIKRTGDITAEVMSGENWVLLSNAIFRPWKGTDVTEDRDLVERILQLLGALTERATPFLRHYRGPEYEANYEDLSYACRQLADAVSGEYENPMIEGSLRELDNELGAVAKRAAPSRLGPIRRVSDLAAYATGYITDVVSESVGTSQAPTGGMRALASACADEDLAQVDVCTLNHDTVVEQALEQSSFSFADGFGPADGDLRFWDASFLGWKERACRILLLKLHGSVDWYPVQAHRGGRAGVARHAGRDLERPQDARGALFTIPGSARPYLLIGTFNKILDYSRPIFADLLCAWRAALRETTALVVTGYSFGDKAVNTSIHEWLSGPEARRLMVINPDENLPTRARPAIRDNWDAWERAGKLHWERKGFDSIEWREIKALLTA